MRARRIMHYTYQFLMEFSRLGTRREYHRRRQNLVSYLNRKRAKLTRPRDRDVGGKKIKFSR